MTLLTGEQLAVPSLHPSTLATPLDVFWGCSLAHPGVLALSDLSRDHRHGMLVWNENRNLERQVIGVASKDEWLGSSVRRLGFHDVNGLWVPEKWRGVDPMYLNDAQALVLRDRNHPSVIIWS